MKKLTIRTDDSMTMTSITTSGEPLKESLTRALRRGASEGCTHYIADVSTDIEIFAMRYALETLGLYCVLVLPPCAPSDAATNAQCIDLLRLVAEARRSGKNCETHSPEDLTDEYRLPDVALTVKRDGCFLMEADSPFVATSKYYSVRG